MDGLTAKNIEILRFYAETGNRELYWNHLASIPGADGYGLLALGVVRNDNLPGQVANAYAQSGAATQNDAGSPYPNKAPTEREWDAFGKTLLERDLERRVRWMDAGKPELALNLPGRDVQQSHDEAFREHHMEPDCWTPRVLLDAARKSGGPDAAEQVWTNMLDNSALGLARAGNTTAAASRHMGLVDGAAYTATLAGHEAFALLTARGTVDPDIIGAKLLYHEFEASSGKWFLVNGQSLHGARLEVTRPERLADLNDTRALRLEQRERAEMFHPDDPYRTIKESPRTAALPQQHELHRGAPGSDTGIMLANERGHADFATYDRIHQWVQETGHWDATASHNVASALYRAQAEDPLVRRVDRVSGYLGAGGEEYVVATYAPHGDKAPFFQARIDGRDAAKHPAHENLLGAEQARQASVQQPLRVPDHEQAMMQPGPVVGT